MAENSKVEKNSGVFKSGRTKTGGRQKGTPNKRTREFLEELGQFSTVKEMISLYYRTEKEDIQLQILKEFLKYEFPQRKAVEVQGDTRELPVININGVKI